MAALSLGHSFKTHQFSTQEKLDQIKNPRSVSPSCCQSRGPLSFKTKKEEKEDNDNKGMMKIRLSLEKIGKGLKESLSPKRKGDWKDLVLMSLSFAVYVYISQKLVCAYCVWTSMLKQW